MGKVFRAEFVEGLRKQNDPDLENDFHKELFVRPWVVYCKRPFFGPSQVIEYIGRYTHKIAISNHRIKSIKQGGVTFTAKDYRHGGKTHPLTLTDKEFIRRFSQHILPKGFTRIRHYGILSSSVKKMVIPTLQEQLGNPVLSERPEQVHRQCPVCHKGELVRLLTFTARGPPAGVVLQDLLQHFTCPRNVTL